MLDYLVNLIARLGQWGYLVIFAGAALESAAFLGLLVPGESLVLVTGFLAAHGALDLDVLILTVTLGAAIGDSIGYEMGRWLGRPALLHYGSHFGLRQEQVDKADAFFNRHGGKSVFFGRFVGFARAIVPFLAGSSGMRYAAFLLYNVLGGAAWSTSLILLGYFLGASWQTAERWIGRASTLLGGVFLFALLLFWVYREAIRHEVTIKRYRDALLQRPEMARLRQRFAPQIGFLQARLSPSSYLGLNLTLGALVLIGASWLFGGLAEDVVNGDPITLVDVQVANWFHAHATPRVTQIMLAISDSHGPVGMSILVALTALYFAWERAWYWLICLLVTVPTGALLNVLVKYAFHRARPSFEHPLVSVTTYSFPSGHASGSALFYGVLAAYLASRLGGWRPRIVIVLCAFALVILVALSRLYLGAHYLSDVLAGMAEAMTWLSLCLVGIHTYWLRRTVVRDTV